MLTPYEIFWLLGVPASLFCWYHIIRNLYGFMPLNVKPPKPVHPILSGSLLPPGPLPKIVFSVCARKLTSIVQSTVDAVHSSCAEVGFTNYETKVVVDSVASPLERAEIVLVPKDFVCRSKYKARALHYALGHMPNDRNAWILHLDEDALVTPQCVLSLLQYIQGGGNPVANGPSVFPYDGNFLTFFACAD